MLDRYKTVMRLRVRKRVKLCHETNTTTCCFCWAKYRQWVQSYGMMVVHGIYFLWIEIVRYIHGKQRKKKLSLLWIIHEAFRQINIRHIKYVYSLQINNLDYILRSIHGSLSINYLNTHCHNMSFLVARYSCWLLLLSERWQLTRGKVCLKATTLSGTSSTYAHRIAT